MSRRTKKLPQGAVEATIESLSHEGRGIARVNGKAVFIDGALPGEQVRFRYDRMRARYDEGYLTEVITASDRRVEPKCPHYGLCGGCSMQHIHPSQQIKLKEDILLEQLQHIGGVSPGRVLAPLTGPSWGYRRKARLGVRYVIKKEKVVIGFREKRGSYLADLEYCEVLHPQVGHNLNAIQALISSLYICSRPGRIPSGR